MKNLWARMAFITRYGHIALEEALNLESSDAIYYMEALANLLKDEKGPVTEE